MSLIANKNARNLIEKLQLNTIRRFDEMCDEIIFNIDKVCLYFYEKASQQWLKDHLQGPLFIYKTTDDRKYSLLFLNNIATIDMKSYQIRHLSQIDLDLEDCFMRLDRNGDYSLAFHFDTAQNAFECHSTLLSVAQVCKGLQDEFHQTSLTVVENPHEFTFSYSNTNKLDLFQNNTDDVYLKRNNHNNLYSNNDLRQDNNNKFQKPNNHGKFITNSDFRRDHYNNFNRQNIHNHVNANSNQRRDYNNSYNQNTNYYKQNNYNHHTTNSTKYRENKNNNHRQYNHKYGFNFNKCQKQDEQDLSWRKQPPTMNT